VGVPRILVIDDSLTIRKLVELSLKSSSFAIEFASSGSEGVNRAIHFRPDVVLLDFVLPDMKGSDVCAYFAKDERTAGSSIIVMTAKGDRVRELFGVYSSVVDYLPKPFAAGDLVSRVTKVLETRKAVTKEQPEPVSVPTFSFAQKESGANAIYKRLRSQFAKIPTWFAEIGTKVPGQFFASKILTPELVDEILVALLPIFREVISAEPKPEDDGATFRGELHDWEPFEVLRLFVTSGRTGRLEIAYGEQQAVVYLRNGDIAFVTSRDPWDYAHGASVQLNDVPREVRERAEKEQQASGKPIFVTLAESGAIPLSGLSTVLAEQGMRTLISICRSNQIKFKWADVAAFPSYIEPHSRQASLAQLSLERYRNQTKEADIPLAAHFERAHNFSAKLRDIRLIPDEGKVLTLVDNRYSVQGLIDASGLPASQVCAILVRLEAAELIRRHGVAVRAAAGRPVVLLDPDVENVQRSLARLLRARRNPIDLLVVDETSLTDTVRREHPRLVMVGAVSPAVTSAIRALRADASFSGVCFVAVVEDPTVSLVGVAPDVFDEVLSKPVHFDEIERILAA
jgi:CheY-like chemotaxis protein